MSNMAKPAAGDGGSQQCIGSGQNLTADSTECRNIAQQATLLSLDSIVIGERHRKDIGEISGRAANVIALFEKFSPAPRHYKSLTKTLLFLPPALGHRSPKLCFFCPPPSERNSDLRTGCGVHFTKPDLK
jgi:hypothetical protein